AARTGTLVRSRTSRRHPSCHQRPLRLPDSSFRRERVSVASAQMRRPPCSWRARRPREWRRAQQSSVFSWRSSFLCGERAARRLEFRLGDLARREAARENVLCVSSYVAWRAAESPTDCPYKQHDQCNPEQQADEHAESTEAHYPTEVASVTHHLHVLLVSCPQSEGGTSRTRASSDQDSLKTDRDNAQARGRV